MKITFLFPNKFVVVISILMMISFAAIYYSIDKTISRPKENTHVVLNQITFEENKGQLSDSIKYLARTLDHSLYFSKEGLTIVHHDDSSNNSDIQMQFKDASPSVNLMTTELLTSTSSYFIGNDERKWITHIPHASKISYEGIYPGVNAIFYGTENQCEYDLAISPTAHLESVVLKIEGPSSAIISDDGDLHLKLANGKEWLMRKPQSYQIDKNERLPIPSSYSLLACQDKSICVGFHCPSYDHTKTLIIDPILSYSSLLGGKSGDQCNSVAVDRKGNIFIVGSTHSPRFPRTKISDSTDQTTEMGYIIKIDGTTKKIIYTMVLGGSKATSCYGVGVDDRGNAYVVGTTSASDFPVHGNALCPNPFVIQPDLPHCAFISAINPHGSGFVYSSYLGGSGSRYLQGDSAFAVAVSPNGNAYVTGETFSDDFPQIGTPLSPQADPKHGVSFVCGISPSTPSFIYSSYLGGRGVTFEGHVYQGDVGYGIAVDPTENVYVTGQTHSFDFPLQGTTLSPEATPELGVAFVSAVRSGGNGLIYSSYLGGGNSRGDSGQGIAADATGNAYVVGYTTSDNFPVYGCKLSPLANSQNKTGFVSAINPNGPTFIYSTLLGGSGFTSDDALYGDEVNAIALDSHNNAYVTGMTRSLDFPIKGRPVAPQANTCHGTAFVSAINATGTEFIYSTLLGGGDYSSGNGIALTHRATTYITGQTYALDFPKKGKSLSRHAKPWPNGVGFITAISEK